MGLGHSVTVSMLPHVMQVSYLLQCACVCVLQTFPLDLAAPPPEAIMAMSRNSTSIMVTWAPPPVIPGVLQGFVVRYRMPEEQYMLANVSRYSTRSHAGVFT